MLKLLDFLNSKSKRAKPSEAAMNHIIMLTNAVVHLYLFDVGNRTLAEHAASWRASS